MTPTDAPDLARPLVQRLEHMVSPLGRTVFVALDGRSGSGTSTVAEAVRVAMGSDPSGRPLVTVIEGDEFYAGGSAGTWDRRSPTEKVEGVIDWRRQREVLAALVDSGVAEWQGFDWESPDWDAHEAPLSPELTRCEATAVVILEGAYSARPELGDLFDLRVPPSRFDLVLRPR